MSDQPQSLEDARVDRFVRDVLHPAMKKLDCHFVIAIVTPEREAKGAPPIVAGTGSGVSCVMHTLAQALADQVSQFHTMAHEIAGDCDDEHEHERH